MFLRKNLNTATGIHCTEDGEMEAVCELGIKSRTFIVPLGCDIPKLHLDEKKENVILFLSRIGEEKGLLYLLDGWKVIDHNGWRLVLAGPDWEGEGLPMCAKGYDMACAHEAMVCLKW